MLRLGGDMRFGLGVRGVLMLLGSEESREGWD